MHCQPYEQGLGPALLHSLENEVGEYCLAPIIASQYLEQFDEPRRLAILRNVGTLIAFRVGVRDAKVLADEFFREFSIEDFVNLPAHQIYVRLMIDGVVARGFSAETIRPV